MGLFYVEVSKHRKKFIENGKYKCVKSHILQKTYAPALQYLTQVSIGDFIINFYLTILSFSLILLKFLLM